MTATYRGEAFSAGALLAGVVLAGQALGQQSPSAGNAPAAAPSDSLEEITVTAQKRSEDASKIPLALSVFSGDTLRSQGVFTVSDIQNISPSVNIGQDVFGVNINIRGVTTTDNTSKGEQGISFNVDGIPLDRPTEEGLAFFDLERVEVLMGPQGTLYGKSSTGGAINVITNKPKDYFEASSEVEIGNFNDTRASAMVNVPVTSWLDIRAAGNFNKRDGFLNPSDGSAPRNDVDNKSGRLSARIAFADHISLLLTGTYGTLGGVGTGEVPLGTFFSERGAAQRVVYGNPFGGKIDDYYSNVNAEFNADIGFAHVTYVGGRLFYHADELSSATADPAVLGDYYWRDYRGNFLTNSQEVRVSNANPGRLDWIAGFSYNNEYVNNEQDHRWFAPLDDATFAGSLNEIDPQDETTHTSYGTFGQLNYHVTDSLKLTLGARESWDQVSREGTFAAGPLNFSNAPPTPWLNVNGTPCVAPQACIGTPDNASEKAQKFTYRVGADYAITADAMVYGSVATGYKAGGFNDFAPETGKPAPYGAENLTAYEVGFKGRPTAALQLNSSAFYYDYSALQITSLVDAPAPILYTRLTAATIYGWEGDLKFRVAPADTVDFSLAIEKSRYHSFEAGVLQDVNWDRNSLDKVPLFAGTAGYSHIWTLPTQSTITARLFTKFSSSYLVSDVPDGVHFTQSSFTRTNLNLTYATADDKFYVQAFALNLENHIQMIGSPDSQTTYSPTAPNGTSVAVSEPLTYGVRVGFKY